MRAYRKWATVLLMAAGLAAGGAAGYAAESHTDSHSDGHSGGKGKGPKYMGGDTSHSSQTHKGGSHHHDTGEGGSKSVEGKIFTSDEGSRGKGPKYMGGKTGGTDHHEGETDEHTH